MTVLTYLKETVGFLEDIHVEEVSFEGDYPQQKILTLALDDPLPPFDFKYFCARTDDGFYFGDIAAGTYEKFLDFEFRAD